MSKSPLFSTYSQRENRVTSSILAVFERIDLSLVEQLLGGVTGETSAIQLVSFVNQPAGVGRSVPDARIGASFAYWIETKTEQNALREEQLREHLKNLRQINTDERLFVITPDATTPDVIDRIDDKRINWFNFKSLFDAINEQLENSRIFISEQNNFLLRELQALLIESNLLDADNVVIVAAREAYPFYEEHIGYICQPGRSFKPGLTHFGFYADGEIKKYIPSILFKKDKVLFTIEEADRLRQSSDEHERRVADLIDKTIEADAPFRRQSGGEYQVFLLTGPKDPQTVILEAEIRNDQKDKNGRLCAWTMGQRYTVLDRLRVRGLRYTTELAG